MFGPWVLDPWDFAARPCDDGAVTSSGKIIASLPAAGPTRRGVWLYPGVGARALVEAVAAAEESGLDEVWVADEGVAREPFTVLAAAAAVTERIRLAVGVTSPLLRHPGAIAAAAATLDELSGGRAVLGLGVGGHQALEPFGLTARRPVRVLDDAIGWARAVLGQPRRGSADETTSDETTSTENSRAGGPAGADEPSGSAALEGADREWACWTRPGHALPPRSVPIWVGARGPRLVRLAARAADGVFMSGCTRAQHERIVREVRTARAADSEAVGLEAMSGNAGIALYQSVSDRDRRSSVCRWDEAASVLAAESARHSPESIGINLVDLSQTGCRPAALVERAAEVLNVLSQAR